MSDPVSDYIEAIRGVPAPDPDNPPVRMELRDMLDNEPKMWELYVLGLQRFQDVDKNKAAGGKEQPLSWFQVAGIHGIPYVKWPNQDWNTDMEPFNGEKTRGFCTHSSILFLPWHRPYLALFEYELFKHVQEVANEPPYSGDAEYARAATNFRIPYWDWADPKRDIFPDKLLQITPGSALFPGSKMDHNSLSSYIFPEPIEDDFKVQNYPRTVRYAAGTYVEGGINKQDEDEQRAELEKFLKHVRGDQKGNNITERTAYVLKSYELFRAMSNNNLASANQDKFINYGSFEDSHNMIHNYTGGTNGRGHMTNPMKSSFDPVFWLHHTNIDRLWAIWQALHPDSYVVKTQSRGGTWSHGSSEEDETTTLTPWFKDSKSTYYKARDCISTTPFGYTYPELVGNPSKEELLEIVDKLYPSGSAATLITRKNDIASHAVSKIISRAKVHKAVADFSQGGPPQGITPAAPLPIDQVVLPQGRLIDDIVANRKYLEWLVNISAEKHAMAGEWVLHIFLGLPDDSDPQSYLYSPCHVSLFSPFGQDSATGCGKCQEDQAAGLIITGQIPLTVALVERYLAGQIESLRAEHVVPFLQEHLHWRATSPATGLVQPNNITSLVVAVVSNEVTLSNEPGGQPRYSDQVVAYPEITTKRDGATGRGAGTGYTSQTA